MEDPEITTTDQPLEYGEWEDDQPMPVTYDEYGEAMGDDQR
jgi:hypothetical protein